MQGKSAEVRAQRTQLKRIEELGALLEEHLILDNRYTEHSTVGLAQQWDQLDQLGKNGELELLEGGGRGVGLLKASPAVRGFVSFVFLYCISLR